VRSILIIGGAGTFGARILRLLAETQAFRLIIGGRDLARAEGVRASVPDATIEVARFDRKGDLATQLAALKPWAVIDAAGPFQDETPTRYAVPAACIELGIHYIDLADSRAFVTGIAALDAAARAAGVAILSGASSVPAFSTAIVDDLTCQMRDVVAIDIALSASNRATAGPSVNAAILSYVGQGIRYRASGGWQTGHGWQCLARKSFAVSGHRSIEGRLVGLCDVPDLDLLPERFPSVRHVMFRAGAELVVQNLVLWLLSFPVRWHWLRSLSRFAVLFNHLQKWSSFLGSDRSALSVGVSGRNREGEPMQALWTLIAEDGHGPWVPSFAAVLLTQKLAAGGVPAGARPAIGQLTLADFAPLFAKFHLFTETRRWPLPPPLYARVLGPDFARMPAPVRAMHAFIAGDRVAGRGHVERGADPVARLVGWAFRFPPAQADVPVEVAFSINDRGETWRRNFAGHRFGSHLSSRLVDGKPVLIETFWPFTFDFDLSGHESGLEMEIRAWRLIGLKLPRALAPRVTATERVIDGRFSFNVCIALPWGPLIVHYAGWLAPHIGPGA
jgi:hypothetical protein